MKSRITQADGRTEGTAQVSLWFSDKSSKALVQILQAALEDLQVTAASALQPELPALSHPWGDILELLLPTLPGLQGQLQPGLLHTRV